MKVKVIRNPDNKVETLGKLFIINDQDTILFKCNTLELPDKNNESQVSCIPKGDYNCIKVEPTHNIPYKHISITNVPNRLGVCIHIGNYYTDILGCIIVGVDFADINKDGQLDLTGSKITFDRLMQILPDNFNLIIQ